MKRISAIPITVLLLGSCLALPSVGGAEPGTTGGFRTRKPLREAFFIRASLTRPAAPAHAAAVELRLNTQANGDGYTLSFSATDVRLSATVDGQVTALGVPRPIELRAGETLPVLVRRKGERIACSVGADAHLSIGGATLAAGHTSVVARPDGLTLSAVRVQPVGAIHFADDFMRGNDEEDPWEAMRGSWCVDELPNPTWSPNAFRFAGTSEGVGLAAAGHWFWDDYAACAAVQPGQGCGAAGIAVHVAGAGDFLVFRWRASDSVSAAEEDEGPVRARVGFLELAIVRKGRERLLASRETTLDVDQWYEFGVASHGCGVAAFLDRARLFRVELDRPGLGAVGLYCRGAAQPVRFDDVLVESIAAPPGSTPDQDWLTAAVLPGRREAVAERFRTDRYMQQWASELGSWTPDHAASRRRDPLYWHIGLFPDDFIVAWEADVPVPAARGAAELLVVPEDRELEHGYKLRLAPDGEDLAVMVVRAGQTVAEWEVPPDRRSPIRSLAIRRSGPALCVSVNGMEAGMYTDPEPLRTRRLGLRCPWSLPTTLKYYAAEVVQEKTVRLPAVQSFKATCPQLLDYLFDRAPVDWNADTGTWEVTARWICFPQFSWLGGRSHENAVLWHKRELRGDVILDVHAAVMMDYGPMSGYTRYGDLNITICGDGGDVSSGYTGMFGGCGNSVTRLYRGDEVVAEDEKILYPARSQGAHQNWYHLRLEKQGAQVLFFVDNRLAGELRDPEPLTGKHVAVWTWNRGLMLARARIWAGEAGGIPLPAAPVAERQTAEQRSGAGAPIDLSVRTHPGVFTGFDRGTEGWRSRTGDHGALVSWAPRGGGGCLRAENATSGGDFSLWCPVQRFDARELQVVSFEHRIPEDVKLNLYFKLLGRWHVVGLTGDTGAETHLVSESRRISGRVTATTGLQLQDDPPVVVGVAPVRADGRWHRAQFDLYGALCRLHPLSEELVVEDLHLANWSNAGYLQCGFGGNRRGAAYELDSFWLGRYGGSVARVSWDAGQQPMEERLSAWRVDRHADAAPDPRHVFQRTSARVEGLTNGAWYVHVGTDPVGDTWSGVRHQMLLVDAMPPTVTAVQPEAGSRSGESDLRLQLREPGGAGLARNSILLSVAGTRIPPERLIVGGSAEAPVVRVDLQTLLTLTDGQSVECLFRCRDRAGNRRPEPFRWSFVHDASLDKAGPLTPALVVPGPSAWDEDFERPSDEPGRFPGSAWVKVGRDHGVASAGMGSLRIEGGPGPYRCIVRRKPFDPRTWPVLSLDYLADDSTVWDLALETDRGWHVVSVNGGTRTWPVLGAMPGYGADGTWRHADLPIGPWLAREKAYGEPLVTRVAVVASNMRGGQTSVLRLDAMRLAPLACATGALDLEWLSSDVSGVAGYACQLSPTREWQPSNRITSAEGAMAIALPTGSAGLQYLHCRARDTAGNWGPAVHLPLWLHQAGDSTAPTVVGVQPEAGDRAAPDTIRVRLDDDGVGVSCDGLVLTVGERRYTPESPRLQFLPAEGVLVLDPLRAGGAAAAPFEDGATVACELQAADCVGNALATPVTWSWTMAFSDDHTPPAAPFVTWRPERVLAWEDFEEGQGQWMGRREGWADVEEAGGATGQRCVRFGGFSTFMWYSRYDAADFPIVGFDYRLDPGDQFNLMVRIENRNWEIRFNSAGAKYPVIGSVPGVVSDGRWHGCRFDLAGMLRNAPTPPRTSFVDHVATLNRSGDELHADNFLIATRDIGAVIVQWSVPRDSTGIRGYSFTLDVSPTTEPDRVVDGTEPETRFPQLPADAAFFHVRACDGAGNWGPAAHCRVGLGDSGQPPAGQ